jgi:hypothetical protein
MGTPVNFENIRYAQDSISNVFQDGRPLQDLIVALKRRQIDAADLEVNVFKDDQGVFWALDNRRTYCIKEAFPGKFRTEVLLYDSSNNVKLAEFLWKKNTTTDGFSIRVKTAQVVQDYYSDDCASCNNKKSQRCVHGKCGSCCRAQGHRCSEHSAYNDDDCATCNNKKSQRCVHGKCGSCCRAQGHRCSEHSAYNDDDCATCNNKKSQRCNYGRCGSCCRAEDYICSVHL